MHTISSDHPVVLIGAGKMGSAMLSGWLASGRPGHFFVVVDPHLPPDQVALLAGNNVRWMPAVSADLSPSVVVIAIKPQLIEKLLPDLRPFIAEKPVFVSIAAGTAVATFQSILGSEAAIIRAMPNTPAQIGRGITIGYATAHVPSEARQIVADLLSITGAFDWVQQETLIDAVTALSGSGPAYVFHLVEAMAQAGIAAGLEPALAQRLARATVEGAGELLYQSTLDVATLRQNVTSPGGTTAAALDILMDEKAGLTPLLIKAVLAAKRRAEELGASS